MAVMGLSSASAFGQSCLNAGCYRYRVIDLGRIATLESTLDLPPNGVVSFGLNDGGILVWAAEDLSGPSGSADALARIAFAGTGPVGTYNLHALAGLSDLASFATDVNESGLVGGASGAGRPIRGTDCRARVWDMGPFIGASTAPTSVASSSLHPASVDISMTPELTSCTSILEMVTDATVPEVIGMVTRECVEEGCTSTDPFVAFRRTAAGGGATGFAPSGGARQSFGFGAIGGETLGYDNEFDLSGDVCEIFTIGSGCIPALADQDANAWSGSGVSTLLAKLEAPGVGPSQVRDTLETGESVGAGYATIAGSCGFHATFWESVTSPVVDLGDVYNAVVGDENQRTKSEAIASQNEKLLVVGGDVLTATGVLWERTTAWCASPLDAISLGGPSSGGTLVFQIRWGHDVNSGGFIIAHGTTGSGDGLHALLLTCPLDLDGSMTIDSGDLSLLLGQWGQPGGFADVTLDGTVDSGDLAVMLGGWTGAAMCEIGPAHDLGDCAASLASGGFSSSQSSEGISPAASNLESALAAIGFASAQAFAEWASTATNAELDAAGTWLAAVLNGGSNS
jgi:hypothetical protein